MRNTPHRINVLRDVADVEVDGIPVRSWQVVMTVGGLVSFIDAEELALLPGQSIEASARIPATVPVTLNDRIKVVNPPPGFEGDWLIKTIRTGSPQHQRLMLQRAT
jgi:hypothetical protein